MTDEQYYRLYLDGDETGLSELMKKYGSALTLYINGYLYDLHEAEDLMIEVFTYLVGSRPISINQHDTWRYGTGKSCIYLSAWKIFRKSRKVICWWKRLSKLKNKMKFFIFV